MKKTYISPVTTWLWIGLDQKVADTSAGVATISNREDDNLPDEGWAREEKHWKDEDAFQGFNKKVWDEEW